MSAVWNTIRDAVEISKLTNGPKNIRTSVPKNMDSNELSLLKSDLIRGGYTIVEQNSLCCGKQQLYWIVSW
jgi:hypothetical protein